MTYINMKCFITGADPGFCKGVHQGRRYMELGDCLQKLNIISGLKILM